ncbi:hypothetical protein [Streptomyces sp. MNU89]|uniref:hypothetical protein n=1 Tax=Streptomyces sp. MNU89 TaxID=2560025 RepID=UPI001E64B557|nr:hypothetical protein [Streptomyces sp. MNU89]MCC9741450.1 hypothetical protein [Streptomyces sp. MNU89]
MRTNDGVAAGGAAGAGGTAGAAAGAGGEGGSVELEFLTPGGEAHRTIARLHTGLRIPGRKPLAARTVTLGDGRRVLQYRLPFSGQSDNAAYGALERQVGAAVALERRYGSERFAEVFTRLVGFDLEAAEPYVLYRAPEGKPLAGRQGTLTVAEQQKLIAQLVLAVRLLEDAGLVHREITPDTVRWDGTHVRLAEPYGAQRIGEPREPFGAAPWAPPEQREGTGTADTRDDLWAVGRLVYFLLSGRPGPAAEPPHDLGEFRRLAAPADSGLFDPRAVNRPRPSDLMRLLQVPDPLSAPAPADPLSAGRAEFDAQRVKKRKELGTAELPQEECYEYPTPPRSWRFWLPRGSRAARASPWIHRQRPRLRPPGPPSARTACCRWSTTRHGWSPWTTSGSSGRWTSAGNGARCTGRTRCGRRTSPARTPRRTRRTTCPSRSSPTASRSPSRWWAAPRPARHTSSPRCWARSSRADWSRTG